LAQGDFVKVECAACQHVALLGPEALLRLGLNPCAKVLDLKGRLRCRGCGRKGRAAVSIKWRGQRA
jgi:ribosomal protein S27E